MGVRPGFSFSRLVCETNGVGGMPSQVLAAGMVRAGLPNVVEPVVTTAAFKQDVFGWMRMLLQQGRLELPRDPALLKQLRALTFEQLPGGGMRIAVPERVGHDDLAMGLCLALSAAMGHDVAAVEGPRTVSFEDVLGDEWEDDESWSISPY